MTLELTLNHKISDNPMEVRTSIFLSRNPSCCKCLKVVDSFWDILAKKPNHNSSSFFIPNGNIEKYLVSNSKVCGLNKNEKISCKRFRNWSQKHKERKIKLHWKMQNSRVQLKLLKCNSYCVWTRTTYCQQFLSLPKIRETLYVGRQGSSETNTEHLRHVIVKTTFAVAARHDYIYTTI